MELYLVWDMDELLGAYTEKPVADALAAQVSTRRVATVRADPHKDKIVKGLQLFEIAIAPKKVSHIWRYYDMLELPFERYTAADTGALEIAGTIWARDMDDAHRIADGIRKEWNWGDGDAE